MCGKSVFKCNDKKGKCVVLNPWNVKVWLRQGCTIGSVSLVDPDYSIEVIGNSNEDNDKEKNSTSGVNINNIQINKEGENTSNMSLDKEHIQIANEELGFNREDSDLKTEQKQQLLSFLGKNWKTFALSMSEIGHTNVYKHRIETTDYIPIRSRYHRISKPMKKEIEKAVYELEKLIF